MYVTTINKKEVNSLKECKEGYVAWVRGGILV